MNKKIIFWITIFIFLIIFNILLYTVEYKGKWPFKSYIQNVNLNVLKDYDIKTGKYTLNFDSNIQDPSVSNLLNNYLNNNFSSWGIFKNFYPWENNFELKNEFDKKKSSFNLDLNIKLKNDIFSISFLQDLYNSDSYKSSLIKLKQFSNSWWNLSLIPWIKEFENNLNSIQDKDIKKKLNNFWFYQIIPVNNILYLNFKESELKNIVEKNYNNFISKETNKEPLEQLLIRLFSKTELKEEKIMSDWNIFYVYELNSSIKDLLKSIYLNNYSLFLENLYKNLDKDEIILANKIIWEGNLNIKIGLNPNYNFLSLISINLQIDKANQIKFEFKTENLNWEFISNTKDIKKEEIISTIK